MTAPVCTLLGTVFSLKDRNDYRPSSAVTGPCRRNAAHLLSRLSEGEAITGKQRLLSTYSFTDFQDMCSGYVGAKLNGYTVTADVFCKLLGSNNVL